jgi:hypothetical protein
MDSELIITGASQSYVDSLLALVGSINLNWAGHPRVLVYDLGLSAEATTALDLAGVEVRKVPAFCPHWLQHFTWKIWCIHDAPCRNLLWLDAGVCVLKPFDEAFAAIKTLGYFAPTNGWSLKTGVCENLRLTFGLDSSRLDEMLSITGCVFGVSKEGRGLALTEEAMRLALKEENMRATEPLHRHDQALLSLLLHRYFAPVVFADHIAYGGWRSPQQFPVQKVWVHRRSMRKEDQNYFACHLAAAAPPYLPQPPLPSRVPVMTRLRGLFGKLRRPQDKPVATYDGIRK